jgi:hypothetical protein
MMHALGIFYGLVLKYHDQISKEMMADWNGDHPYSRTVIWAGGKP